MNLTLEEFLLYSIIPSCITGSIFLTLYLISQGLFSLYLDWKYIRFCSKTADLKRYLFQHKNRDLSTIPYCLKCVNELTSKNKNTLGCDHSYCTSCIPRGTKYTMKLCEVCYNNFNPLQYLLSNHLRSQYRETIDRFANERRLLEYIED